MGDPMGDPTPGSIPPPGVEAASAPPLPSTITRIIRYPALTGVATATTRAAIRAAGRNRFIGISAR
jgi:hypothetical protein